MMHTHTPAEWAQMVSLALAIWGTFSVPYFIAVDADLADFDPRPALETGRLAPAYQVAVHVGHDLNRCRASAERIVRQLVHAAAEAWRDAVALVLMLATRPKGPMSA